MARVLSLLVVYFLAFSPAWANPVSLDYSKASLISELKSIEAAKSFWVAVHLELNEHWHSYWLNPGDSGLAMKIDWELPKGFEAGDINWQVPERIKFETLTNYGYNDNAYYLVKIDVPDNLSADSIELRANARWLVCDDICVPQEAKLALELPVSAEAQPSKDAALLSELVNELTSIEKLDAKLSKLNSAELSFTVNKEFTELKEVFFYPETSGLIKNNEKQLFTAKDGQLEITVLRDLEIEKPLIKGFLELQKNDGSKEVYIIDLNSQLSDANQEEAPASKLNLLLAILFAFLGGIVLNAMPCVFPVLSLKILSMTETKSKQTQAIAYTLGIVFSFLVLAAILMLIKSGGSAIGWGYQMQSPLFVSVLIYLFFIIALNLFGLFEFAMPFSVGNTLNMKDDFAGSFMTGVLATVVATPCSAPFMATAVGFALSQPIFISLLIFTSLGLGLAFPYLLVSYFPKSLAWLPKPGAWMETFKQALAFPILLTVVWLIWVLAQQIPSTDLSLILIALVLISFSIWLWRQLASLKGFMKFSLALLLVMLNLSPLYFINKAAAFEPHSTLEQFSREKLSSLRKQNKAVFVDATAAWCLTCKVNEKLVLSQASVKKLFEDNDITFMTADWTNQNAEISEWLDSFGRSGVPLYVYYPADGSEPKLLPQILTEDIVRNAIMN